MGTCHAPPQLNRMKRNLTAHAGPSNDNYAVVSAAAIESATRLDLSSQFI